MTTNKGGQPQKTLTPEQVAEVSTLDHARMIKEPIVYGLQDSSGALFYVGKTTIAAKRFASYKKGLCHGNLALGEKLSEGGVSVIILSRSPENISDTEKHFIKKYRDQLINVVGIKTQFYNSAIKPWFAGTGIRHPSDGMMFCAAKTSELTVAEAFKDVYDIRNKMTDAERCAFEVSIYRDMMAVLKKRYSRWFESCSARMLECMQNAS